MMVFPLRFFLSLATPQYPRCPIIGAPFASIADWTGLVPHLPPGGVLFPGSNHMGIMT